MSTNQFLDEIDRGEGLTLSQLARRVPRTRLNLPVTLGCVLRWVIAGTKMPSGPPVKLEALRLAGKWITTPGAFRRFMLEQTPIGAAPTMPRTAAKRSRAADRAARELEAAGV
jgi:hypothetical protein